MTETVDATQAAETPVPDDKADSSPAAADTSEKSAPKETHDDDVSEKVQKRISKLTGRWRQAESEADYWRERYHRSMNERPAAEPPRQAAQPAKKLADFNYDEEQYQAYLEEVVAEKAAAKATAKLRETQERERSESSRKENLTKFREREAKVKGELEDYEDFAYTAPIDSVTDLIMAMDEGPRIAYYLGKNPETAARINSLPPHLAAIELGRLDAKLATEREQAKAKSVSKAPPPVPRLETSDADTGFAVKASDPSSDKLSMRDWMERREKELKRKR